ncbi:DNA (cytosine-5)-methyltransferase CMT2-like isoform X2 [Silene latifolia]|uniref:DNA (cytosine-5)-methyltransferase CMT2-like isoform X2 n=1 Tax=Silene latifolia TaxID=37657 RepID=UPI003D778062
MQNRRNKSRSLSGNDKEEDEPILNVKCHYVQAEVNGKVFHLGDCALIRGDGKQKHIGRIIEFLRTMEDDDYFRVQWFYKPEDTVMKKETSFHDKKRIFYSTIENDNMLDCIISKLNVTQISPELKFDLSSLPPSDYYYDMEYCLDYSTFRNLPRDNCAMNSEMASVDCLDPVLSVANPPVLENGSICETYNLLDLYAGCGAMSTGLCIGARHSGVNLVTRWAIDLDSPACKSIQLNHSETQVRNEAAEDFLELLKHWEKLCKKFVKEDTESQFPPADILPDLPENKADAHSDSDEAPEELEVSSLLDICYGDSDGSGKQELKFKVRWKGYGPDDDTWEPIEGLSNCQELIQDFVINGFKRKLLPLPGDVDVICGGPPCQGISGYNRFRCVDDPLSDERNRQLIVFMDIVDYLKPKFVLMENVTDILRFDKGSLGRYALSRLVHMRYQARVGIIAAGCYGVPQFRLRAFFWGALPSEELPQFPLPTHDVVVRYWPPAEFERNLVGYEEGQQTPELEDAVLLGDAISDLPVVTNFQNLDEMPYRRPPETEFQKYIRSNNCGCTSKSEEPVLYDHRPFQLFEDDYIRVCKIPQKKGANFRDLPGLIVGDDNVVRRDPSFKTLLLPSGKPMVPEYALTFEQGKSKRPFARLWWDETMPTIVTAPNCHCQALLHPEQDRVLTIRECARLQGFPDSFRLWGTVKQRYRQVGNAVAIPVAKALGYALGMASQKATGKEALLTLPPKFAYSN